LPRTIGRQRIIDAVLGIFLGVVLMAYLAAALIHYQMWVYFDTLCRERPREQVATIVSRYPDWPEWAPIDRACDQYLTGYLIGLGGKDKASTGRAYELTADHLLGHVQFASCIEQLNCRAWFFEYILQLPSLAEACQRCAVTQCRRHYDETKEAYQNSLGYPGSAHAVELKRSSLLLAQQTEELAMLFCLHEKLELADRAYQDAITSAAFATNLEGGGKSDASTLQSFYLAYAAFLYTRDREENALAVLDKMNEVCGQ
jgi:hypothetical protein